MKVVSYGWNDDDIVGNIKIACECGNVFEKDTIASGDIIECEACHKTEEFTLKKSMLFVPIQDKKVQT